MPIQSTQWNPTIGTFLFAWCLLTCPESVHAAEAEAGHTFYAGGEVGAALVGKIDLHNGTTLLSDHIGLHPQGGWAFVGTIGYRFDKAFHVSLDIGYSSNGTDGVYERAIQPRIACVVNGISGSCPPPTSDGRLSATSALTVIHYDVPVGQQWTISGAAGGGIASFGLRVTTNPTTVLPKATTLIDSHDTRFALVAGLDTLYALSPRLSLVADYRYLRSSAPHFNAVVGPGPFTADGVLSSHTVRFGIRTPL